MRTLLLLCFVGIALSFTFPADCNPSKVYANKKQTQWDDRFSTYEKISGVPKFKGGDKSLETFLRKNLVLSKEAQNNIFNLNYQFTVTCEGKVVDARQIGDAKMNSWTNFKEAIQKTEGLWQPAKHQGEAVNCVYFGKLFIKGS
ncbi:MAG: hypothetical protein ACFB10_16435 [Salibacteraceae bacterium]